MELPAHVKEEDVKNMLDALSGYRAYNWWYQKEKGEIEKSLSDRKLRYIDPVVMHGIRNRINLGTYEYSLMAFNNILDTAIVYQAECNLLHDKIKKLETEVEALKSLK